MKLHYCPETDSHYIENVTGTQTREIVEGLVVDLDENDDAVGFDIDHTSRKLDLSRSKWLRFHRPGWRSKQGRDHWCCDGCCRSDCAVASGCGLISRHCERSEAIHLFKVNGLLRRYAPRNDEYRARCDGSPCSEFRAKLWVPAFAGTSGRSEVTPRPALPLYISESIAGVMWRGF